MISQRQARRIALLTLTSLGWLLAAAVTPVWAGTCVSNNPDEIPPFLTTGVDPNVLMIIDNSASMYDMAYLEDATLCYDDTYDPAASYAGYFAAEGWYAYEGGKFVSKSAIEANNTCGTATHRKVVAGVNHICLKVTGGAFDALVTKGNFLNWAAASKLDIEKQILTGGKYVSADSTLQMESRGCLERRFIRKTSFTTGGYLTLAVRPPTPTEQMDAAGTATRIEIFPVTSTGYSHEACQQAIDEMKKESPNLGQLKGYIDECMGYTPGGGGDEPEKAARSTFNHSIHDCWYMTKQGLDQWMQTNTGSINRIKNDCQSIYEKTPIFPWNITTDHSGYLCFGDFREPVTSPLSVRGYVGRCWNTGTEDVDEEEVCVPRVCTDEPESGANPRCVGGYVYICSGNYNVPQDSCNKPWVLVEDCTGGEEPGFVGWMGGNACIEQGLLDYCNTMNIPEVVDPSDQVTGTGDATDEFWNLPSVLVDAGVLEQMGEPLLVMAAKIAQSQTPTGLLQEFAADLRIGAMIFNRDGAKSECERNDLYVTYQCEDPTILDGGRVITPIGKGPEHTQNLVNAINAIVADTWTPLAETMYNAIGYYLQDESMRLAPGDFSTGTNPITAWCQVNNIILITDGAPTADQNPDMISFAESLGYNLGSDTCDSALHGSTYLDDLAYYAYRGLADDISLNFAAPGELAEGKNRPITTHVVAVGNFRDEGADKCSPDVLLNATAESGGTELYRAEDLNQLESELKELFGKIRAGAAAGSAASVISATRSGEGAVYQAIFWPEKEDGSGNKVYWSGEVQALFVDDRGQLFEDTNGNGKLDHTCPDPFIPDGDCDRKVTIFHDSILKYSRACYGSIDENEICSGPVVEISEVKYIWTANNWLQELSSGDVLTNRSTASFMGDSNQRHIFTWYDLNGDGVVNDNEIIPFEAMSDANWSGLSATAGRPVHQDLGVTTVTEAQELINWLRGLDQAGLRSRYFEGKTWRLGDVVHSTPTVVSRPAEGYHFLYRDRSYARFANRYNQRRHMIYFGGNDGMLHAVNGGFFNSSRKQFCLTPTCEDKEPGFSPPTDPLPLGAEVWAYVPYNLWPHLSCLADPEYGHKYYVDQTPRIFDVQIFEEEAECAGNLHDPACVHPGGWGTILVGSMRFGGEKKEIGGRTFTSSYFILDITNPEQPPRLLAEMTHSGSEAEMGFTTAVPAMVPMVKYEDDTLVSSEWYLVLGSGPTNLKGESNQTAKVAVISLRELIHPVNPIPFRIPATPPIDDDGSQVGSFTLTGHNNSFVSDLVSVDFGLNFLANTLYFGTVSGSFTNGWGGSLYRLVTENYDGAVQTPSKPSQWAGLLSTKSLDNPLPLIEVDEPVTAGPAISWDGRNYWVYFGTGRLYNRQDFNDNSIFSYYGIKEPRAGNAFTWNTVIKQDAVSDDGIPGSGEQGLLRVDQIEVQGSGESLLECLDESTDCLPTGVDRFQHLLNYIAGDGTKTGTDGWYRKFHDEGERNLGQATVLGGLLTFSSYLPSADPCALEGFSELYALYYQTGTAWRRPVFIRDGESDDFVEYRLRIGPGLAITPSLHVGTESGAKVFLQTSTGAIVSLEQPELPFTDYKAGREWWREIYREMFP